jgi:DNA helicase IV
LDRQNDVYRDGLADLACHINDQSDGLVVKRLEALFDHIYIDEMQDLVGYDLDFLDLLLRSKIMVTAVGDPRQFILRTSDGPRNKKYRGVGMRDWVAERASYCERKDRTTSARCGPEICAFASSLFPDLPALVPAERVPVAHEGIHRIAVTEVDDYVREYAPIVLRHSKATKTFGHVGLNIGVAKGATYDHVLICPTGPMKEFLVDGDASNLKRPESLYVAVTRARRSVAFVV